MKGLKTGGRQKGSKNAKPPIDWKKFAEVSNSGLARNQVIAVKKAFKIIMDDVVDRLQANPETDLYQWAVKNQTEFWQLRAKLEPKELNASVNHDFNVNISIEKTYELPPESADTLIERAKMDEIEYEEIPEPMNEEAKINPKADTSV